MGSAVAGAVAHLREPAEAGCQRDAGNCLSPIMVSPLQRKANLRMAWILAALAAAFGVGFFVRIVVFGA